MKICLQFWVIVKMLSANSMVLDLVEGWEVGSEVDRGDYFCLLVYVPGTSVWYMVKGGGRVVEGWIRGR